MKLVIDIPDEYVEQIKNNTEGATAESEAVDAIRNGIPYEERPQGDLISREALKKELNSRVFQDDYATTLLLSSFNNMIDNAPTISDRYAEGYAQGYIDGSTGSDWRFEE